MKRLVAIVAVFVLAQLCTAFAGSVTVCGNAEFNLPNELVNIQEQAFMGIMAHSVYLSDNTVEIGPEAFADCMVLEWIRIPASVTSISENAFKNCSADLKIYGVDKSKAQEYAYKKGYHFYDEVTGKEIRYNTLPEYPIP